MDTAAIMDSLKKFFEGISAFLKEVLALLPGEFKGSFSWTF